MTLATYSTSIMPSYDYILDSRSNTLVSNFDSGIEQRSRLWRFPRRIFSLDYKYLNQTNRDVLHEFYRKRSGQYESFFYYDLKSRAWDDEFVGYGGPVDLDAAYAYKGGTYTDETEDSQDATANDVALVPATDSAVGDAIYCGTKNVHDRLVITITTAGSHGCVGAWEYYSATGGWAAHTVSTDQTNSFTVSTGTYNVDVTPSSNWVDYEVNGINQYWSRFRISATSSANVRPLASRITANSKDFSLPGDIASSSDLVVYENATSTTAYSVIAGGGAGGADRIRFTDYPTQGNLITCDFTGNLRIRGRLSEDQFREEMPFKNLYNVSINIQEVSW